MSLEAYTGKISDLVDSNPTPTDPKSQGDDHLRGIKYTMKRDCVRVSGSPIQQMGVNANASENHFWDSSVQNQLSLKRGTPDAPGVELIKALNGVVSFPQMPSTFPNNNDGSAALPGGLIIKWKRVSVDVQANVRSGYVFEWITPFPTACFGAVVSPENGLSDTSAQGQMNVFNPTITGAIISGFNSYTVTLTGFVIAVGR